MKPQLIKFQINPKIDELNDKLMDIDKKLENLKSFSKEPTIDKSPRQKIKIIEKEINQIESLPKKEFSKSIKKIEIEKGLKKFDKKIDKISGELVNLTQNKVEDNSSLYEKELTEINARLNQLSGKNEVSYDKLSFDQKISKAYEYLKAGEIGKASRLYAELKKEYMAI